MNPLIPTAWDITLAVLALAALVLAVVALVSVLRSRVGRRAAVLWALFVVTLPVVGAVAWFVVRRRARRGMIRPTLSASLLEWSRIRTVRHSSSPRRWQQGGARASVGVPGLLNLS